MLQTHREPTRSSFRRSLRPGVILPILLAFGLIVLLLELSGFQQALQLITHFRVGYLVFFALTAAIYEVARCVQWCFLLDRLDFRLPRKTQIFSYGVGELAKNLPIGNFIPDYVLTRAHQADFGRASSATLLSTLIEVGISLAGVVIIGIDGWDWLRPVILVGTFIFALLVWTFSGWHHADRNLSASHPHHPSHAPAWMTRPLAWPWVRKGLDELRQFSEGEATLLRSHVVAFAALCAAVYLIFNGLGLYVTVLGLGFTSVTWYQVMAASFFSLAFALIIPLPMDLGPTEVSGTGALVAMGMSASGAVSAMLLFRFLMLVVQILVACVVSIRYPAELRATLRRHH